MCLLKFILHLITSWVSLTVMAPRHSCHANPGNNPWIFCCPGDCGKSWNAKHMRRHRPTATAIWSFYSKILIFGSKIFRFRKRIVRQMQIFTQEINLHSECSLHVPCLLLVFFSKQLYFLLKCISCHPLFLSPCQDTEFSVAFLRIYTKQLNDPLLQIFTLSHNVRSTAHFWLMCLVCQVY